MKYLKKTLALLFCLSLLCAMLPSLTLTAHAEVYFGYCGGEGDGTNLTWTLDSETWTLTIEGSGKMYSYLAAKYYPWYDYRSSIRSITISSGVTTIGSYAFMDCRVSGVVTIPDSVTLIDSGAFKNANHLGGVMIPGSVARIGGGAFSNCTSLVTLSLGNGITRIEGQAFSGCSDLGVFEGISIPETVTYIGADAFRDCKNLKSITIPDGVTTICERTFYDCIALKSVIIPDSVTKIGYYAFRNCKQLESLYISDSVTEIGADAFESCNNLTLMCSCRNLVVQDYAVANNIPLISEHDYKDTVIAPGCTEQGYTDHTCSRCGDSYVDNYVDALGHDWDQGTVTTEPTYTSPGVRTFTCNRCGMTEAEEIPPLEMVNPFVDVKEGKYYYNAVLWACYYSPQITNGTDETHFSPSKDCTREQIVTFLWKAAGAPEPSSTNNPFTDVKSSKYYYKAVLWAVQNGITNGISADKFGVGQPCKREQVVTFLWKTAGAPDPETTENPFTDVKEGKYYYKAVMWAVENKITSGVSADKFGVGQTCTRGQIVTFLYKYMEG